MSTQIKFGSRNLWILRRELLLWYDCNRRDLPWRKTRDPYRVWISEIMLQQTRVAAVVPRYEQFLRRFPSVQKLAAAREPSVLAEWSGLGYYRRARNLHAAAKLVARQNGEKFPGSAEAWGALPGIGRYTAAAIASIAFNERVAVLDGNVERVLRRLVGRRQSSHQAWAAAQELLDHDRPGDFNQAMMELGATVCLPGQPQCGTCPIRRFCVTRGRGESEGREAPRQRREITCLIAQDGDSVRMVRRPADAGLMPGMWELPAVTRTSESDVLLFSVRHSITVTDFKVRVIRRRSASGKGNWVRISRLKILPLTGLARKILRAARIIQ